MSANIPETKLVSELLKPTGFNCPADLEGKTFTEATEGGGGGGADIEDNKSASINVSAYTVPVVINPSEGKDAMKKATVTLTNIPSSADIETNKAVTITENGTVEITPTSGKDAMAKVTATVNVSSSSSDPVLHFVCKGQYYENMYLRASELKSGGRVYTSYSNGQLSGDFTTITNLDYMGSFSNIRFTAGGTGGQDTAGGGLGLQCSWASTGYYMFKEIMS